MKILITGAPGAGKTYLANTLGEILNFEVIRLDELFWKPGWVRTTEEERLAILETLKNYLDRHSAVIEGKYVYTVGTQLSLVDMAIFLDPPQPVYLWQIISRHINCLFWGCEAIAPGCPYRIRWTYVKSIWYYPIRERAKFLDELNAFSKNGTLIHLRSQRDIDNLCLMLASEIEDDTSDDEVYEIIRNNKFS